MGVILAGSGGAQMQPVDYGTFVRDLFAGLGVLKVRPMFGVSGLFCDGVMFGVIADERIFLKADDTSRSDFLREDAAPFVYRDRNGGEIATSYYELPARLFDDRDEAVVWARRAYEVALHWPGARRKQRKRLKSKPPRQPQRRRTRS